jgi:hypothetical protein
LSSPDRPGLAAMSKFWGFKSLLCVAIIV